MDIVGSFKDDLEKQFSENVEKLQNQHDKPKIGSLR